VEFYTRLVRIFFRDALVGVLGNFDFDIRMFLAVIRLDLGLVIVLFGVLLALFVAGFSTFQKLDSLRQFAGRIVFMVPLLVGLYLTNVLFQIPPGLLFVLLADFPDLVLGLALQSLQYGSAIDDYEIKLVTETLRSLLDRCSAFGHVCPDLNVELGDVTVL